MSERVFISYASADDAEHSLGHARESDVALAEMRATHHAEAAYPIARVYAWRGEKPKADEWLDTAYRRRDGGLEILSTDATVYSLRE
jgi:hypothetical protein